MEQLPKQAVPLYKKLENDKQWAKETIDHIAFHVNEYFSDDQDSDYSRMLSNYQLYNNILNQKDFEHECNPLGIEIGQFKDSIKPYNKTYNKINVLLGEELKRRTDYKAVLVNQDGIRTKEQRKGELLRKFYISRLEQSKARIRARIQKENPAPEATGDQQQDQQIQQEYQNSIQSQLDKIMDPDEIEQYMSTEYQDAREILAQRLINYFMKALDIRDKKNDAFKHSLLSGKETIWVGTKNNQPTVEVLNPLGVFYSKSPDTKYLHKAQYAGYRSYMSSTDILNLWSNQFTEEELDRIEGSRVGVRGIREDIPAEDMRYVNYDLEHEYMKQHAFREGAYGESSSEHWEVFRVEWVSRAKVYFHSYTDEEGESMMDILSENVMIPSDAKKVTKYIKGIKTELYERPNGETFEPVWIPEVWEGVRIGTNIYVDVRKKEVQFRSLENPFEVSLGFYGLVYNNMNALSQSAMDRMKPYQYLYFIIYHKMKRLIARDEGQIYRYDLSMVPEKLGLEKSLYYLKEVGIDFFNSLENGESPGVAQRGQITTSINMSNMANIMNYVQLLQHLDAEIGEACGVPKQREGAIGSYEAVTNTQQVLTQSSHITEKYFFLHNKVWEQVLNALIQTAQFVWKDQRVVKQYVLDDLSREVIDFEGEDFYNADLGIFISNDVSDTELINTLKQMALPILQNEGKLTDIIKIYKSMSSAELHREFKKEEAKRDRAKQQQEEMNRQMQQQQIEATQKIEQDKRDLERYKIETENNTKILIAELQANLNMFNPEQKLKEAKLELDEKQADSKMKFEEKKHKDTMDMKKQELRIKEKQANKAVTQK